MRVLYVDCDSLRPDHLGCYGYHRDTSPNIDRIAERGRRFTNYYASDAPCLPSRTALFTGRFGIHTGVINHGGINADIRHRGARRGFSTRGDGYRTWMAAMRDAGHHTALISPFPQRHAAWPVIDGFEEWHDTGGNGSERADEVAPYALDWLDDHATDEDWYLHVNFWDPHTRYDTPLEYGFPFEDEPAPEWPDEDTIQEHYESYGPHSAREVHGWGDDPGLERAPAEISSRGEFVQWIDGYDTGIRFMDEHVGRILDSLEAAGVLEETLVIVSADHGENQGELNVYGDHQTADERTCNVPLVMAGPGVEPGIDDGFHYQVDLAPTVTELVGGDPAARWDGQSFAGSVTDGDDAGREFLVVSQGAWACQRAVRWEQYIVIRTYHDGLKQFEPVELYDLASDPHETENLARERPELAREGIALLEEWHADRMVEAAADEAGGNPESPRAVTDPMWEVIREGGPHHAAGHVESYAERLRETDREEHAAKLDEHRGLVPQDVNRYLDGESVW